MRRAFIEHRDSYTDEAFAATVPEPEALLGRLREGPVWVAVRDASIVGTVSAVHHGESLYIRGMAVTPAVRSAGIGNALLNHVETYAAAHGCKRLVLSTTPFLDSAIRLYTHLGVHADR